MPLEPEIDLSRVQAVIFDVDGTLYRQAPLRRAMAVRLVRAYALHPIEGRRAMRAISAYREAQEHLRTVPGRDDLAATQLNRAVERSGLDHDAVERTIERWMYQAPLAVLPRFVQPGLVDLLEALRARGIRLAVLSDYPPQTKLEALGIADLFHVVLCAQQAEIGVFKPHPRGIELALERLSVDAADALYVGDRASVDAVAAAAAKVPCAILSDSKRTTGTTGFIPFASFREMSLRLETT